MFEYRNSFLHGSGHLLIVAAEWVNTTLSVIVGCAYSVWNLCWLVVVFNLLYLKF